MNPIDLTVRLGRLSLPNPILVASGTFGYAREMEKLVDLKRLGGIVPKTITKAPRAGNAPWRTIETAAGMLNSIGLDNDGQEAFLEITRAAFNLIHVDRERLANQFATATALARDVPVRRLTHPRRLAALPAVCERVIADVKALNRQRQRIGTAG